MSIAADILGILATQHAPALLASVLLLVCSATFSSCETSLFSLTAPELNRIRTGTRKVDRILVQLHANLQTLLPTMLFCNMGVNVLIYALAAAIGGSLGATFGAGVAFAYGLASLFLVVFFGEVFPKQFAIASSLFVARLTCLPVWIVYRVLAKPLRVLNAIVAALERVVVHQPEDVQGLREEELRLLVELSRHDGAISEGEYQMIDGIVDLPEVRVRDIMVPRIDVATLAPATSPTDALAEARRSRHCKLPVHAAAMDDLSGWVDVRDIYAAMVAGTIAEGETVETYMKDFQYFSEHDRADQALERIKGSGGDLFAVVDERGIVVGFFTLQDIMDEVLGHFGENGAPPPSEIREMRGGYVISGRLSVREWRDIFNVPDSVPKSATVGGLVVSLLGRIPKVGDRVELHNMEMTVLSTWHNRVMEVGLRLVDDDERAVAEKKMSTRLKRGG
ncbi:MAG: CNNM domain-containing protein [Planctomycetaceae bacterium]|nr:CNNM domain-containing protein [Planctomycetaceae bacterium]